MIEGDVVHHKRGNGIVHRLSQTGERPTGVTVHQVAEYWLDWLDVGQRRGRYFWLSVVTDINGVSNIKGWGN